MGRRKRFTIVELFICLALLTIMGGVLAMKSQALIQDHQFTSGAKAIQAKVDALKTMSLVYEADVQINLVFDEGVLSVSSFTHERFPLVDKTITLKCASVALNDQDIEKGQVMITPTLQKPHRLVIGFSTRQATIKI